jgi:Cu/Ag efflux protein CusF
VRVVAVVLFVLVTLGSSASAADRDQGAPPDAEWEGTGVVLALLPPPSDLHATRPVIVIQHDPIKGLMDGNMAMPFIAASTDLFRDVHVGDHITFALKDTPGALLVVKIKRLSANPRATR